eukprot:9296801-Pyramimonas_sp.AAC.1
MKKREVARFAANGSTDCRSGCVRIHPASARSSHVPRPIIAPSRAAAAGSRQKLAPCGRGGLSKWGWGICKIATDSRSPTSPSRKRCPKSLPRSG